MKRKINDMNGEDIVSLIKWKELVCWCMRKNFLKNTAQSNVSAQNERYKKERDLGGAGFMI